MSITRQRFKGRMRYRFDVTYELNGVKRRKSSKWFSKLADAVEAESNFLENLAEEHDDILPFSVVLDEWSSYNPQSYKLETLVERNAMTRKWFPMLLDRDIYGITAKDIKDILVAHEEFDRLSTSRKNRLIGFLNGTFEYAKLFYDLPENPMDRVSYFRRTQKERLSQVKPYTPEQFALFLAQIPSRNIECANLFYTLYHTGMRLNEALSLTFEDVKTGKINIHRQWDTKRLEWTTLKTYNSRRIISCNKKCHEIFEAQRRMYENHPLFDENWFIFGGQKPLSQTTIDRIKRNAMDKAGLPRIRLHSFRHAHTSNLLNAGVPMFEVSRRLGHASIQTTSDIYGHTAEHESDVLLAAIEQ